MADRDRKYRLLVSLVTGIVTATFLLTLPLSIYMDAPVGDPRVFYWLVWFGIIAAALFGYISGEGGDRA